MRNAETPPVAGRHWGTWGHMHPSTYVSGHSCSCEGALFVRETMVYLSSARRTINNKPRPQQKGASSPPGPLLTHREG